VTRNRTEDPAARRRRLVAAAVADGRLSPSSRERWLNYLAEDPSYEQTLASLAQGLPPDLRAAASRRSAPVNALRASGGRFPAPRPEEVSGGAQGEAGAARLAAAHRRGGEPTLFSSGDLPPFTTSGIPVEALLEVPWQARHPLATAATAREAYEIVDFLALFSTPEAVQDVAAQKYGQHPRNREYALAVETWLLNGESQEQVLARMSAGVAADVQARFRDHHARRGDPV
jgi:hypothetical protein